MIEAFAVNPKGALGAIASYSLTQVANSRIPDKANGSFFHALISRSTAIAEYRERKSCK